MGRGYSATRSHSARKTTKIKRRRSLSKLRDSLTKRSASSTSTGSAAVSEGERQQRSAVRIKKIAGGAAATAAAAEDAESEEELEESENEEERVSRQDVMTKYKLAGKLTDDALRDVIAACVEGANTKTLCETGNQNLLRAVLQTMKHVKDEDGKRIARGLSFPTTVCVNNVLCNHSPFQESEAVVLKAGDVVKVHVGCHIDGFPVSAAKTIVVGSPDGVSAAHDSTQRAIDAARVALAGMIRLMHPGAMNADITDFIHSVGHSFNVEPVEGCLSTRTKRWIPDSLSAIIARRVVVEDPQQDVADVKIGLNQVWMLDVAFTDAPSYKMQESPAPVNIFRRNEIPAVGDPRLKAAEEAIKEIDHHMHCFPFTPSMSQNPLKFRLGVAAMRKSGLLDHCQPLQCKKPHVTTRFTCTVAVTSKRVNVICGDVTLESGVKEHLPKNIAEVLAQPLSHSGGLTKKERKALAAAAKGEAGAATAAADVEVDNDDDDAEESDDDQLRNKRKRK